MRQPLTDKQLELLVFMQEFFRANDQLPPLTSIMSKFSICETAAEWRRLRLEKRGYIERNAVGKFRFTRETEAA